MAFSASFLNDDEKRTKFLSYIKSSLPSLRIISLDYRLYRGARLHPSGECGDVAFFTPVLSEAEKYAKFEPRTIYCFDARDMIVVDLTDNDTIAVFQKAACDAGIPKAFVTWSIALDVAANVGFERDFFSLLKNTIIEAGFCGFLRRTFSSTLHYNATEVDIYRDPFVPDYIM